MNSNRFTLVLMASLLSLISYAQSKGSFTINTNPKYAYVSLLGFPDIKKKTPAEFENYRALQYQVQISKHNYHSLDTVITCHPDSITNYNFNLVPKTGSLNITTIPERANVYFNNQAIGVSPIVDFPVPCGANTIRIESPGLGEYTNTYVINEDMPLSINQDFTQKETANNNNIQYSTPIQNGFYQEEHQEDEIEVINKSGFANFGLYAMLGSNGAKGTSYRYGIDLFHYIRLFGETNSNADINGVGIDLVLPLDLDMVALYGKTGYLVRNFEHQYSYNQSISINFVTIGGGLSIKPSPHFQIFAEFEVGFYDEEEVYEDIQALEEQFPGYSAVTGWLGIRVAL